MALFGASVDLRFVHLPTQRLMSKSQAVGVKGFRSPRRGRLVQVQRDLAQQPYSPAAAQVCSERSGGWPCRSPGVILPV